MIEARILVVDDEAEIRKEVVDELKQHVSTVLEAEGGKQALALIDSLPADQPIDLILSDIRMPGMDGLALLQELRRRGNRVAFVVVSAFYEKANVARARQLGAADFIEKPYSLSLLRQVTLTTLNAALKRGA